VLDFAWIATCAPCSGTGKEPDSACGCRPCAGTGRSFVTGYSAPCVPCAGTGDPAPRNCIDCGGTGRVPHREQVVVEIPAGCRTGAP
jgi:DnaJ-class molecular chaperone